MKNFLKKISIILTILIFNFSVAKAESEVECAENLSRVFFNFNQSLDKSAILPSAKLYNKMPIKMREMSGNFVSNIGRLLSIPTNILQGDIDGAGDNLGGFIVNTILGFGGLNDAATGLGIENKKEDFGQVLGFWGVDNGCYFVLPLFGPTTVRDSLGMVADRMIDPFARFSLDGQTLMLTNVNGDPADYYITKGTGVIDFRAKNITSFDNLEKNSLDLYSSFKSLYLQDRSNKINNNSSNNGDWEEFSK